MNFFQKFLRTYFNRKLIAIFLINFGGGTTLAVGFSILSFWLRQEGIKLSTIGGLVGTQLPYSLKFLWAPLVDQLKIPFLTQVLGKRRAWLILLKSLLALVIFALGQGRPSEGILYLAIVGSILTFISATRDIFSDAYRIEVLEDKEQKAGAAAAQSGYLLGMALSGALAFGLSDYFSWNFIYTIMACLMGVSIVGIFIAPEKREKIKSPHSPVKMQSFISNFEEKVTEPFIEFTSRKSWLLILSFITFYKYGDAVFGTMAKPFYADMEFSGREIALASQTFGVTAQIMGTLIGGLIVLRKSLFKSFLIAGIFQALTNLIFICVSITGQKFLWLVIAICADNFTGAVASVALVTYLSLLCHKNFSATQYALFTSLSAIPKTTLSMVSGFLVENLGWSLFFTATTGLALPGLILLFLLKKYSGFQKITSKT